ncbi:2-amino-4-hydroxy-6-hydroxymethyldihydropteridine diphosphokinase [Actinomyces ruminis]|uniref:2-amino-4-hydroxy-6-hydroxymethyldihydropteridine diphosphokinase n=1 Tax=Actinomyces ruminis TaxID=1937003 RepID=A0ABX4MFM8_9ACTO|nr:2-amino-4-hydroxy-6-hydroxymethyldihydropteridine diphosphokinase [Actinomyces ruminis]
MRPQAPAQLVIALGGNVGGVVPSLRTAVNTLRQTDGITVSTIAPLARTAAVVTDGVEQPDYLNTVVLATTTLSPREVLAVCQDLEAAAGRVRTRPQGPAPSTPTSLPTRASPPPTPNSPCRTRVPRSVRLFWCPGRRPTPSPRSATSPWPHWPSPPPIAAACAGSPLTGSTPTTCRPCPPGSTLPRRSRKPSLSLRRRWSLRRRL